jgi:hypothetical protein
MLAEIDGAADRLGATRSELFRAAVRGYLRQLEKDEALLARTRAVQRGRDEDALATQALASRRSRRSRVLA